MKTTTTILALALSLALLMGCGNSTPSQQEKPLPTVKVKTAPIVVREIGTAVTAPGSVHGMREAAVASRIMGQVKKQWVKAGQVVKHGTVLLTVDDRTVQGQIAQAKGALAQAQAAYTLAERNLKRFTELYERQAASQLELDMAQMQNDQAAGAVEQARGAVKAATSMLDDAKIQAPFSGTVLDVMIKEGDMVVPGYPVIRLADFNSLQLWVDAGESDLDAIRKSDTITCSIPAVQVEDLPCTIGEIVSAADPQTHTFTVKLRLGKTEGITPGMYGKAVFTATANTRQHLYVPRDALLIKGQLAMVYTVKDAKAAMRMVRIGETAGGQVEILSGLNGSEMIVTTNPDQLSHGQPVEVEP